MSLSNASNFSEDVVNRIQQHRVIYIVTDIGPQWPTDGNIFGCFFDKEDAKRCKDAVEFDRDNQGSRIVGITTDVKIDIMPLVIGANPDYAGLSELMCLK